MQYDTIIIGAGSAGCILAARLSEDASRSILLLEAGPDFPNTTERPPEIVSGLFPAYTHDWDYVSEPDLDGYTIKLPRGKLVGGCSAINATFALRGSPSDYDEWAAMGNFEWSFTNILPYFRELENDMDFDNDWHGCHGPVPILRYQRNEMTNIQADFLDACTDAGYLLLLDLNAPQAIGVGPLPKNSIHGMRYDVSVTHLNSARARRNLQIRGNALVDIILFDKKQAIGVQLAGSEETVWGDKIIVCAGSYGSPVLLMRSGIGPGDHLASLGISVEQDLPGVGQHLSDHPAIDLFFEASPPTFFEIDTFQTLLVAKTPQASISPDLHIFPRSIIPAPMNSPLLAILEVTIALLKPRSVGQVWLRSRDALAPPYISLGYFTHNDDMQRMIEGVQIARNIFSKPPLERHIIKEVFPGKDTQSDSLKLEDAIRRHKYTYSHPTGTCHMGPTSDPFAVVDQYGNVHGIKALSVVDASIMPSIPSANTNLPTMMVAERMAHWK